MDWKVTLTETVGDSEAADVADPTPLLSAIDGGSDEDAESCNLNAAEQEFGDFGVVDDELDVDGGGGGDDDVETGFWGTWTTERFASEFVPMEEEEGEEEGEVVQAHSDGKSCKPKLTWVSGGNSLRYPLFVNHLISFYSSSGPLFLSSLVFCFALTKIHISYTSLASAFARNGHPHLSLSLFHTMHSLHLPFNNHAFPITAKATCSHSGLSRKGRVLRA
ncbi:hypothetical protein QJS10_CPB17g01475 [Acorus calamus]|uniref:Uncharacterized protein n=1 Tax=Acorus calamus TaxID=4465 RepID=A0AAV9CSF1_ACOCL|nr:hypothetical protein QJS10_CPB17g01475 [Acorus calamus]